DDWRGLTMLVENAVLRGDLTEAERAARQLLESRPDWESSHLNLAYVLAQPRSDGRKARKSRYEAVRDSVSTAVALAPEHIDTLRRASIFLAITGDENGSTELLNRALALDPTNEQLLM